MHSAATREYYSRLVKALGIPDFDIALAEDAVAIGASLLIVIHL